MPLSLLYWILMLLWLIAGFWWGWGQEGPARYSWFGWSIILFLMFLVLGLRVFGAPIKGG